MKKRYHAPNIKVLYLEELCGDFVHYSVIKSDEKTQDSQFDVHTSDTENPGNTGSSTWYDDSNNWGGD